MPAWLRRRAIRGCKEDLSWETVSLGRGLSFSHSRDQELGRDVDDKRIAQSHNRWRCPPTRPKENACARCNEKFRPQLRARMRYSEQQDAAGHTLPQSR